MPFKEYGRDARDLLSGTVYYVHGSCKNQPYLTPFDPNFSPTSVPASVGSQLDTAQPQLVTLIARIIFETPLKDFLKLRETEELVYISSNLGD